MLMIFVESFAESKYKTFFRVGLFCIQKNIRKKAALAMKNSLLNEFKFYSKPFQSNLAFPICKMC